MNNKKQDICIIKHAKQLISARLALEPSFHLFLSINNELDYLFDVLEGRTDDKSRLQNIKLGTYAVKEFEESDPELSEILKEVYYIVHNMLKSF